MNTVEVTFVIDADIPFAGEMFTGRADVRTIPGSRITRDSVRDADILLVRSVTKVNERLLGDHRPRFVGTATIGTDHLDVSFLRSRGIPFANAPGCNSTSVAEYVVTALLELAGRGGYRLAGKSIGVVGVGNVGSKVAARASALGMKVMLNDPPLARKGGKGNYLPLGELLGTDFLTLHVPLSVAGPDPTRHLVNSSVMASMKRGSVLINTSRGAVVDTAALKASLEEGHLGAAVLDVWEGEPSVDIAAVAAGAISTPHIAGYSADGKARGASMMYREVCRVMGWSEEWRVDGLLPPPQHRMLEPAEAEPEDLLRSVTQACYPIMRDDAALRKILTLAPSDRDGYFNGLRDNYPVRREFGATTVRIPPSMASAPGKAVPRESLSRALEAVGFTVASPS